MPESITIAMVANLGGKKSFQIVGLKIEDISPDTILMINNEFPGELTLGSLNCYSGAKAAHYLNPLADVFRNKIKESGLPPDPGNKEQSVLYLATALVIKLLDWCYEAPKATFIIG